ncbi:matrix metalloproteinase-25-like [Diorhabda sublineata]|uniref:matrix metalloproteinase-25-like n=1 Tax=Diorhabda sublineata TaxID=1163346 RepID=UPI0024E0810A|nr:matrix metalloproteinase-25-like [Diorhabda sublineata]
MRWKFCFVIICALHFGTSYPFYNESNRPRQIPNVKALEFMKRYGYLQMDTGDSEALYTEQGISDIIKVMQRYGGIEETGKFDKETEKLMLMPRCGVPDIIKVKRQKRYVLGPEGWQKRNISYFLSNWSPRLGESVVQKSIQKALDQWGGYGRLTFYRKQSPDADIIVQFGSGNHGDNFPFDGPGSILAHAFFPQEDDGLGGDIHFDADENWIDTEKSVNEYGTDFYVVALHELGHSLGLQHSPVKSSIMFPYYQDPDENGEIRLGYDDILGMYELYIRRSLKSDLPVLTTKNTNGYTTSSTDATTTDGFREWFTTEKEETYSERSKETTGSTKTTSYKDYSIETSTVKYSTIRYEGDYETVEEHKNHDRKNPTSAPRIPDICDGRVDAIATLRDELFVFSEKYVWRFRDRGILVKGYPIPLNQMFPTLPETVKKIDAAYQRPDGSILLFTGDKFWIYDGRHFSSRSPEPLTHLGLPEYVYELNAVQNWKRNRKTYFYSMDRFWRYNETSHTMDPGYPQHMRAWRGVPSHLDAAITWKDDFTYFFRGGLFWKFDNNWIMITEESPMPAPTYWFGCPEKNNVIMSWFLAQP